MVEKRLQLKTVSSTNDIARDWALAGITHGAIRADQQLCGRGRLNRRWDSPKGGNLYASYLRTPIQPMKDWPGLSLAVSLAIAEALEAQMHIHDIHHQASIQLKWPNDLLLEGKKIAGILLETVQQSRQLIIGIGINLKHAPSAFNQSSDGYYNDTHQDHLVWPAGSLFEIGIKLSASKVFTAIEPFLDHRLKQWMGAQHKKLLNDWCMRGPKIASKIVLRQGNSIIKGWFYGIDNQGSLQIAMEKNGSNIKAIYMGEIVPIDAVCLEENINVVSN